MSPETAVREVALRFGDDALIAAQRLAEWSARAPEMEEDIALSNIALDQLGAARLLLSMAGDEDELAFLRGDAGFRNCLLVELPNAGPVAEPGAPGDFGVTMAKLLFLSAYQHLLYEWLAASTDRGLADIGAKARKESRYHLDHATQWTVRLGDGTAESRRRMQAAVDDIWPYTHELFTDDELAVEAEAAGVAPLPSTLKPQWTSTVEAILARATLRRPDDGWAPTGGRAGRHTEHLSYLLAEMQVLHRAHPGGPMVNAYAAVARVVDPELRVLTISDLGILRTVEEEGGHVTVTITPTYSGCPAMDVIRDDIQRALAAAGFASAEVRTVLRPAWSTDMITEAGRAKLAVAGIAPPSTTRPSVVALRLSVACPRCGSPETEEISRFGSTACKALWRCRACGDPFDRVKPL